MSLNLKGFSDILRDTLKEFSEHPERFPPRPTQEQMRAERKAEADRIRASGGTPWEVWTEGYKGQGASIPAFAGIYDAPTFDDACRMAVAEHRWMERDGEPYHSSEQEAWAGFDRHWSAIGGVYAPDPDDPRRPPKGRVAA